MKRPPLILALLLLLAALVSSEAASLRVMSYNIHRGVGNDGKLALERIAEVIKEEKPDLVGLQEVDRGTTRSRGQDQARLLAEMTGMHVAYGKNIDFQGGAYGNAILSRFPILAQTNHLYALNLNGEQRGLLQVRVKVEGRTLNFFNTHLDYHADNTERLGCARELVAMISQLDGPLVVTGDFNAVPESPTIKLLRGHLTDSCAGSATPDGTIPSSNPRKRIDYVFSGGHKGPKPTKEWIPRTEASDHLPLVVDFDWE